MPGFDELEVKQILIMVQAWATQQPEIDAVALVGSWARKEAHQDSDIDLMILTLNPKMYFQDLDWFNDIPWHNLNLEITGYDDRTYGVVRSRHLCFQQGQQIEFSFGFPGWANINPIDRGTLMVVRSGIEIVYDRHQLLKSLVEKIER